MDAQQGIAEAPSEQNARYGEQTVGLRYSGRSKEGDELRPDGLGGRQLKGAPTRKESLS